MSDKVKLQVIPFDCLIDLQISGAFYARLQGLFMRKCDSIEKEILTSIIEKLKNSKRAETDLEEEIMILTGLVSAIEKAAVDQKKTREEEFDPKDKPTED